jgi:small subunit ribosomal protein S20
MPHTRSARKNLRKSEKRRLRNRAAKRTIKEQLKAFYAAVEDGTVEAAQKEFNLAAKRLDKAAARRVIHPNTAARKKSQLAIALRKKGTPAAPAAGTPATPPGQPS